MKKNKFSTTNDALLACHYSMIDNEEGKEIREAQYRSSFPGAGVVDAKNATTNVRFAGCIIWLLQYTQSQNDVLRSNET